jgi:diguanylate cyclase (GGDEF)-like protein/PAS domain S-box-containing protein
MIGAGEMRIDPELVLEHICCSMVDFALITFDVDGHITSWNRGAEAIFGYTATEVTGQLSSVLFTPEDRAEGHPEHELAAAQQTGRAEDVRWHMRKDGGLFWSDGVMTPMRNADGALVGYLKLLRDITAAKLAHDTAERLASFDMLTGVANRTSFDRRLPEMLAVAERGCQQMLLFAIDLDRFKEVNDQFGHHAGDLVLKEAAWRISHTIREGDLIARLGGDEFALVQLNPPSVNSGAAVAEKLLAVLAEPFYVEGRQAWISGSVGIAVYPTDATNAHELRSKADLALYQAKRSGRNCFHYFTGAMDEAVRQRNFDKIALRGVVANSTYQVQYQPIVNAATGDTITMEALLRFPGSRLAAHPVDYTIDLAREIGLICTVGAWVFRQVCMQLKRWHDDGIDNVRIAVNTCAQELLEPSYLPTMESLLDEFGLTPASIEIELTEREAIELSGSDTSILARLHSKGFLLVLDDFGTGYSSLSYLRGLPIDVIKLHRSFLQDIPVKPDANKVVTAVISLAHALSLNVTAEGVETEEQASFLKRSQCQSLQGYLYARAMTPAAATSWLQHGGAGNA